MISEILPFEYDLPEEKIALRPVRPYDSAKLLVSDKNSGELRESSFRNIVEFLSSDDVLVFNNTKVIRARLFASINEGKKAVELLLVAKKDKNCWLCMAKPLKSLQDGTQIFISQKLGAQVMQRVSEQLIEIEFHSTAAESDQIIYQHAVMPIPPYIRKGRADTQDLQDYQSHFAEISGSIAAPTAGLHFTPELMRSIKAKGITVEFVTMHLGAASFRLLKDKSDKGIVRVPDEESYFYDKNFVERIFEFKKQSRRIIAVGTSVVRALESMASREKTLQTRDNFVKTDLFIYPGYHFKLTDCLVTNFHLPGSSHLLLVQALMGSKNLADAYDYALNNNFRFLSYGDGMLIY